MIGRREFITLLGGGGVAFATHVDIIRFASDNAQ